MPTSYPAEWSSRLVCVREDTGAPILTIGDYGHKMAVGDLFDHTVEGVTTSYKVESSVMDIETHEGQGMGADGGKWMTLTQRITASVVP